MEMWSSLYLLFILQSLFCSRSYSLNVTLALDETLSLDVSPREQILLHLDQPDTKRSIFTLFHEIKVDIEGNTILGKIYRFPFHSISGISTDDGYAHFDEFIGKFVKRVLKGEESDVANIRNKADFLRHYIRDIFSSCPSPFFSSTGSRHYCSMRFSPYGSMDIAVKPNAKDIIQLTMKSSYQFNPRYIINFIVAIGFLTLSHVLSKSKVFQYTSGAILFMVLGILWTVMSFLGVISTKKKNNLIQNMSWFTLLTGTYSATVVWIIRTYMTTFVIDFWELTLAYLVISGLLGCIVVYFLRSNDTSKHILRVSSKWIIRMVGIILLFFSSASPALSWLYLFSLPMFYLLHLVQKSTVNKVFKK